jgi:hypothetical protein
VEGAILAVHNFGGTTRLDKNRPKALPQLPDFFLKSTTQAGFFKA